MTVAHRSANSARRSSPPQPLRVPNLWKRHELIAVKCSELAGGILFDRVEKGNAEALLLEYLNKGQVLGSGKGFTSNVVNRLLAFRHASDAVCFRSEYLRKKVKKSEHTLECRQLLVTWCCRCANTRQVCCGSVLGCPWLSLLRLL